MNQFDQASAKSYLADLTGMVKPQLRSARLAMFLHGTTVVASMTALGWWIASSVEQQALHVVAIPLLALLFLLRSFAGGYAQTQAQQLGEAAQYHARARLLLSWQGQDSTLPRHGAERANLMVEPIENLYGYYARFVPQLTAAVTTPLVILLVVVSFDWVAALFLLLSAPLIPVFMALVGMGAARLNDKHIRTTQRLAGLFVDRVRHLTNLQLFNAGNMALRDIDQAGEQMREANMATLRVAFLSSAVLEFFSAIAIAAIAIYVGFALLGFIDFGPALGMTFLSGLIVLLLAPEFFQPLRTLSSHYHDRAAALAAAGLLHAEQYNEQAKAKYTADGSLSLQGVSVGYQAARPVLSELDLYAEKGQTVLLNGPSGSGKTTLLKLLSGEIVAQQGELRRPYSKHIAYMAQSPYLKAATIAENLSLISPEASEQAMQDALAAAHLNKPLDYELREQGLGLSGGEQRRLALARMFLKPSPMMLFDEPTAGLDETTAKKVIASISALQDGQRVLVIASHDPALDSIADIHVGARHE